MLQLIEDNGEASLELSFYRFLCFFAVASSSATWSKTPAADVRRRRCRGYSQVTRGVVIKANQRFGNKHGEYALIYDVFKQDGTRLTSGRKMIATASSSFLVVIVSPPSRGKINPAMNAPFKNTVSQDEKGKERVRTKIAWTP
jgi:hypothetical protein